MTTSNMCIIIHCSCLPLYSAASLSLLGGAFLPSISPLTFMPFMYVCITYTYVCVCVYIYIYASCMDTKTWAFKSNSTYEEKNPWYFILLPLILSPSCPYLKNLSLPILRLSHVEFVVICGITCSVIVNLSKLMNSVILPFSHFPGGLLKIYWIVLFGAHELHFGIIALRSQERLAFSCTWPLTDKRTQGNQVKHGDHTHTHRQLKSSKLTNFFQVFDYS